MPQEVILMMVDQLDLLQCTKITPFRQQRLYETQKRMHIYSEKNKLLLQILIQFKNRTRNSCIVFKIVCKFF